uniref:Uncharacterized protein n=1 Tax=Arundo donax TaxID=35708 RepID=A0A0A8ZFC1_ARUDO
MIQPLPDIRFNRHFPIVTSASMYISCVGLSYASATAASAVANLLPV